jgi:hypothetical protein
MREGFIEVNALPKVRSECNWMDAVVIGIEKSQVSAMSTTLVMVSKSVVPVSGHGRVEPSMYFSLIKPFE